jgi:prophage regulatory protein
MRGSTALSSELTNVPSSQHQRTSAIPRGSRLKARYRAASLPETGFVRLETILALIPVSRSTWWAGVQIGRFPAPVKLGPRITAWRVEDIHALIERWAAEAVPTGKLHLRAKTNKH